LAIETLEAQRRVLADGYLSTLTSMDILRQIHLDEGEYGEAWRLLKEATSMARDTLSENNKVTLLISVHLAHVYRRQARHTRGLYPRANTSVHVSSRLVWFYVRCPGYVKALVNKRYR
jgi:hypothetical protein